MEFLRIFIIEKNLGYIILCCCSNNIKIVWLKKWICRSVWINYNDDFYIFSVLDLDSYFCYGFICSIIIFICYCKIRNWGMLCLNNVILK